MKCKNLGISIKAEDLTQEDLDNLYEMYETIDEIHNKKRNKVE